ncbi:hypothetical protein RRG08_010386 [Elysia crispata]|uniref:Uncharacterized protein n=1 Tax=Elysia crispata TaxID=231223 RepID=A0AAE1BB87_9GAST|nr:hypothetical protein RRG08_010386 [Elysia crispata]
MFLRDTLPVWSGISMGHDLEIPVCASYPVDHIPPSLPPTSMTLPTPERNSRVCPLALFNSLYLAFSYLFSNSCTPFEAALHSIFSRTFCAHSFSFFLLFSSEMKSAGKMFFSPVAEESNVYTRVWNLSVEFELFYAGFVVGSVCPSHCQSQNPIPLPFLAVYQLSYTRRMLCVMLYHGP